MSLIGEATLANLLRINQPVGHKLGKVNLKWMFCRSSHGESPRAPRITISPLYLKIQLEYHERLINLTSIDMPTAAEPIYLPTFVEIES